MNVSTPIGAEVVSELIGSIYDCAIDAGRWAGALTEVREALSFHNAAMNVISLSTGKTHLDIVTGIPPEWIAPMLASGADVIDQWGGAEKVAALPLDEPAVLSWVNPRKNWENNPYYRNWAVPQGLIDVMAVGLAKHSDLMGTIGFGRHGSAGEIGMREVDAMRLLLPHLQRAVAIGKLLELKTLAAETHRAALDALRTGILLVDEDLRIVHANDMAQSMLDSGDPLRLRAGALATTSPAATKALGIAVRQASDDEAAIGRRGFGIPAPLADGSPCVLHVLPLRRGAFRPSLSPNASAAVFVASGLSHAPTSHEVLEALFDLTGAEARVFSLIAAGRTPQQAAEALGVAFSTVKTHLIRIFTKTGARRQVDLVRLAASIAMPV